MGLFYFNDLLLYNSWNLTHNRLLWCFINGFFWCRSNSWFLRSWSYFVWGLLLFAFTLFLFFIWGRSILLLSSFLRNFNRLWFIRSFSCTLCLILIDWHLSCFRCFGGFWFFILLILLFDHSLRLFWVFLLIFSNFYSFLYINIRFTLWRLFLLFYLCRFFCFFWRFFSLLLVIFCLFFLFLLFGSLRCLFYLCWQRFHFFWSLDHFLNSFFLFWIFCRSLGWRGFYFFLFLFQFFRLSFSFFFGIGFFYLFLLFLLIFIFFITLFGIILFIYFLLRWLFRILFLHCFFQFLRIFLWAWLLWSILWLFFIIFFWFFFHIIRALNSLFNIPFLTFFLFFFLLPIVFPFLRISIRGNLLFYNWSGSSFRAWSDSTDQNCNRNNDNLSESHISC